jgi:hypothetical protein
MRRFSPTSNKARVIFAVILVACAFAGLVDPVTATAAGMFLSFETVAGSTLSVSVTAPATFDVAGYGALGYTLVGEITDLGQGLGRKYNIVEHAPIASRQRIEKKASYSLGSMEYMMAWDMNDAGQDLCRAAALDDSVLSIKVTKQGGDIRYFTAQVSEFVENFGTVDNVVQGKMTLLRQKDVVYNPA